MRDKENNAKHAEPSPAPAGLTKVGTAAERHIVIFATLQRQTRQARTITSQRNVLSARHQAWGRLLLPLIAADAVGARLWLRECKAIGAT